MRRWPRVLLGRAHDLAIACAQAGFGDQPLGPREEEALATVDGLPGPLPEFSAALRRIAASQLPTIPAALPTELQQLLTEIAQAIRDAQG